MKEIFPMTIKGVVRTCLGDVFEDQNELDQLSTAYHNCWKEMEVHQKEVNIVISVIC